MCGGTLLVTTLSDAVCCLPRIFFVLNMTLGVPVCLYNPQTEVCLLLVGTCILPDMTLDVVVRLYSHQTKVYPLHAWACLARP